MFNSERVGFGYKLIVVFSSKMLLSISPSQFSSMPLPPMSSAPGLMFASVSLQSVSSGVYPIGCVNAKHECCEATNVFLKGKKG